MSRPDLSQQKPSPLSRRRFLQNLGAAAAVGAAGKIAEAAPADTNLADANIPALPQGKPPKSFGPGAVPIELKINGQVRKATVEPRVTLLDTLRDRLDLTGAKKVCDRGTCGACTVIMNGQTHYSCMLLAVECAGAEIETIEGLAAEGAASPVSKAFAECDALQCGFCTPGFVMTITHHLRNEKNPTLETVRQACRGNLCRCGTYNRVFEAALLAATGGAGLPGGKKEGK